MGDNKSIRLLIAVAAVYGFELNQMDVLIAFVNLTVTEEIH